MPKIIKEGPFVATSRAKKTKGRSVKVGGTVVLKKRGKKPIAFKKGGLHEALGIPQGKTIPAGKKADALAGKFGPRVKRMAVFAFKGPLSAGRATVARKRIIREP